MPSDPFDRALRQWEARRDIAALDAQRKAIHEQAAAKAQPLLDEIKRIEAETWPEDFHDAMWDADLALRILAPASRRALELG